MARAAHRAGETTDEDYAASMLGETARVIAFQEGFGLDVLVNREPESNDMVQYLA